MPAVSGSGTPGPTPVLLAVLVVAAALAGVVSAEPQRPADQPRRATPTVAAPGDCVFDEGPGVVYPEQFTINCQQPVDGVGDPVEGEAVVTTSMQGAWAYEFVLELPDDASPDMGSFEVGGTTTYADRYAETGAVAASMEQRRQFWQAETGRDGEDTITVIHSNPVGGVGDPDNGAPYIMYKEANFEHTMPLHPGIYDVSVRAYMERRAVDRTYTEASGTDQIGYVVDNAEARGEWLRLAVGPCDPEFEAGPKLEALDKRELEILSDYADAKRQFSMQRFKFTVTSAKVGGKIAAAFATSGAAAKGGPVVGKDIGSLVSQMEKGREAVRKQATAIERFSAVQQGREQLREEIDRCYGGGYQVPDDYRPVMPSDREEARQPDGDTVKG
jgi:hypothetical protein